MNRNLFSLTLFGIFLSCHTTVSAQTGTRINEAVGSTTQNIIWFSEPHEIEEVRQLLVEGNNRLALQVAEAYVKRMERVHGVQAQSRMYHGLNALCSALTSNGDLGKAVEACDQAIELYPDQWQAYNNRGTARYLSRQYDLAIQDYRYALEKRPDSNDINDIIQHNINLAETRRSTN